MTPVNENFRYSIQKEVVIEDFKDGSLVVLCKNKHMIEINHTARRVLDLMDGKRSLKQIIKTISLEYKLKDGCVGDDIQNLVNELVIRVVIKPVVKLNKKGR